MVAFLFFILFLNFIFKIRWGLLLYSLTQRLYLTQELDVFSAWMRRCLHITYQSAKHIVIPLDERYRKDTTSFPILTASLLESRNQWQNYTSRTSRFEVENMAGATFLCGKQHKTCYLTTKCCELKSIT